MMRLDSHIHTYLDEKNGSAKNFDQEKFLAELKAANMDGGAIITPNPIWTRDIAPEKRMEVSLEVCRGSDSLFPLYWIDPIESDALDQVQLAVEKGFDGFKMIPHHYDIDCRQSMEVMERIASFGKPILFHAGIAWDGVASANRNRPGNFEALIEIPKLRFALAHVAWPWFDECIAVYGKFNNAYSLDPDLSCEMFIDVTPGTPRVFREETFRHLLCSDYELRYNLMFGTDCNAAKYNISWSNEWQARDNALYDKFIPEDVEDFKDHVYGKNLLRFLGKSDEVPVRRIPMVGE